MLPRWSVSALASEHGFALRDVSHLTSWPHAAAAADATGADVLISVYFRYLIPQEVLEVFPSRAVNFHPAPLPRYRGPSPILAMMLDRSILTDGCMTLHALNHAFDAGPIIAREPVALSPDLNIRRYNLELAQAAARLTGGPLQRYFAGELTGLTQDESRATFARPGSHELCLSPDLTAEEIRWRCQTLAKVRPLRIDGVGVTATGFHDIVGPRTGERPAVGLLSVEFDASDARVRVWRKPPFNRHIQKLRNFIELARMPAGG
jgi:methionyl-tRNA formyltransferase